MDVQRAHSTVPFTRLLADPFLPGQVLIPSRIREQRRPPRRVIHHEETQLRDPRPRNIWLPAKHAEYRQQDASLRNPQRTRS